MIHGNCNHIAFYIHQVEHNYNKFYTVRNGWGDYVRPVAMLVTHRFTGIKRKHIARYFKCSITSVTLAIGRQKGYEDSNDPKFIQHYNQLLELYIQVTRFYIRKKRFINYT